MLRCQEARIGSRRVNSLAHHPRAVSAISRSRYISVNSWSRFVFGCIGPHSSLFAEFYSVRDAGVPISTVEVIQHETSQPVAQAPLAASEAGSTLCIMQGAAVSQGACMRTGVSY